jgi:hypothetical protein
MAPASSSTPIEPTLTQFLQRQRLATPAEQATWTPLSGGVSSDIWRVDLPGRTLCVKRALAKLRVGSDWYAPVNRNRYEWEWLRLAAQIVPRSVPQPLAHDPELGLFAMSFLPGDRYPLWKRQLLDGNVDVDTAAQVGGLLATLHNATAGRPDLAAAFDCVDNFRALRLGPYLLATGAHHPDLQAALGALVERTAEARIALDAECAWFGDPAFDIAFCLNHLLLKSVLMPQHAAALLHAFDVMALSYFETARFEQRAQLEARAASLLPALTLARIDGKSPVEYLVGRAALQDLVRDLTRPLILQPAGAVAAISRRWRSAMAQAQPLR